MNIGSTFQLADQNKVLIFENTTTFDISIPSNSSISFPIGTRINLLRGASGNVRILPGPGVTLNSPQGYRYLRTQNSWGALYKRATDTWYLTGDLGLVEGT
jgi:hypothetical protein